MVITSTGNESRPVRRMTPRSRLAPSRMMPPFRQSLLTSPTRKVPICSGPLSVLAITTPNAIANTGAPTMGTKLPTAMATAAMAALNASPTAIRAFGDSATRDAVDIVRSCWIAIVGDFPRSVFRRRASDAHP
jgi:hypothetical protein